MWLVEKQFKIILGGNTYIDVPSLVVYDGQTLFTLKRHDGNGELGIYFELYEAGGEHIASVKRNQIYPTRRQGELYTLEGSADEYLLRKRDTGQNVCQIRRRNASRIELHVSVRLYTPDGFLFEANPTSTNLGGVVLAGNTIINCATGISIARQRVGIG